VVSRRHRSNGSGQPCTQHPEPHTHLVKQGEALDLELIFDLSKVLVQRVCREGQTTKGRWGAGRDGAGQGNEAEAG
jgi:hypothetical protein